MTIPLKSDKTIDVILSGFNNVGTVMVKINSFTYLKDCNTNCLTCTSKYFIRKIINTRVKRLGKKYIYIHYYIKK